MAQLKSKIFVLPLVLAVGALMLSGCDKSKDKKPHYDGVVFKIKTKPVNKKVSRADFTVEIKDAALSFEGARLAADHAGVKYCLTEAGYGTSRIKWDVNPQDPEAQLRLVDGSAVFQGTCES